ncbi:MAG: aldose epimerase [Actinobacteria bacterium]|nr:aldose epimerase [Actinomycetota bacterium]
MSNDLHLGTGWFGCSVDALRGARLSSLRIAGRERLVAHSRGASATSWGAYPMVPYAGRVRRGKFQHAGREHQLPLNFGAHAIHGTVFDVSWSTLEHSPTRIMLAASLGDRWPFSGHVTHEITLDSVQQSVTCTLEVTTTGESMPAQVGWHPWFVRPARLDVDFAEMYVRDADYIATAQRIPPPAGPWDDCFTGSRRSPEITFDDGTRIVVDSDCDHWVIYDMPTHALCVEPQSGPPDGFTLLPQLVTATQPLRRTMTLLARRN